MRGLKIGAVLAGTLLAGVMSSRAEAHRVFAFTAGATWTREMLQLVNADRGQAGLPALRLSHRLTVAAQVHSLDMAEHRYFSHTARNGETVIQRFQAAGVRYHEAGENLGEAEDGAPLSMLRMINGVMMQSSHHRANLLDPQYRRIGISVVFTGQQVYVTEDFAG
jgi:uncharacterized protein YkwD